MTTDGTPRDEAQIRGLIQERVEALRTKDSTASRLTTQKTWCTSTLWVASP
jgi:hypothetical protein